MSLVSQTAPKPTKHMPVDLNFNVWEGVYASFADAPAIGPGFEGEIWRERSMEAACEVAASLKNGQPLDYSLRQRNALLPVTVAMLLAERQRVSILDFGGGLGIGFMVLIKALPDALTRVDYRVVEVDSICDSANEFFAGKTGPLFETALPASGPFDIVQTASTIQYVEDWRSVVARLAGYGARYLLFADAFVGNFESYVTLQNYYGSRIRHWFFNRQEFVAEVEGHGYGLVLRSDCDAKILGTYGALPMDNFPAELRIPHSSHLLFHESDAKSRGMR